MRKSRYTDSQMFVSPETAHPVGKYLHPGLSLIGDIKPLLVNEALTIQKLSELGDDNA